MPQPKPIMENPRENPYQVSQLVTTKLQNKVEKRNFRWKIFQSLVPKNQNQSLSSCHLVESIRIDLKLFQCYQKIIIQIWLSSSRFAILPSSGNFQSQTRLKSPSRSRWFMVFWNVDHLSMWSLVHLDSNKKKKTNVKQWYPWFECKTMIPLVRFSLIWMHLSKPKYL